MRKILSLGLLALILGGLGNTASAGNVDECEFLKDKAQPEYVPGLYGLCVAWHSANANGNEIAAEQIASQYAEKSGGGSVPGSGGTGDVDPPFECPCWISLSDAHICDLSYMFDSLTPLGPPGSETEDIYQGVLLFTNSEGNLENFGVAPNLGECTYQINFLGVPSETGSLPLNPADGLVCGMEIQGIKELQAACVP